MAGNSFIKFDGVPDGESLQKGHEGSKGWIEISDWNWEIEAEHSVTKGTGAAVGKPMPGVLSITHYFDNASPVIMNRIVQGTHFPQIWIHMLKSTGSSAGPEIYIEIVVTEAFVTKVSTKGGEDGAINQDVDFVFKQIHVGYKPQDNKGKLEAAIDFDWSVKDNKAATTGVQKLMA